MPRPCASLSQRASRRCSSPRSLFSGDFAASDLLAAAIAATAAAPATTATAAAVVAAVAATTTPVTTTAVAASETTAAALGLRARFVHGEGSAPKFGSVQRC